MIATRWVTSLAGTGFTPVGIIDLARPHTPFLFVTTNKYFCATHKAKELGRNRYQFFTEEINSKLKGSIKLERGIVNRDELVMFYRPIVDLKINSIVAFEAFKG